MNFLNTIGRGLGAIGHGATAALDYAALGGLPLNTLYPQGVPGEVRSNLRRNFLSNMGMALSANQPAMGPAMHRESAAGYLQNLAAQQQQQALRSAIGNIVGDGKDVDYDKLASMYASLGMTEEANRYASLAESRRNGLSSRTIAAAGEARNAQAFPVEQRGRELNNQQTQQNVAQRGQAFPVEQRGRELANQQTQQAIAQNEQLFPEKLTETQLSNQLAAQINPWKVQTAQQEAQGTQPITPYQNASLDLQRKALNEQINSRLFQQQQALKNATQADMTGEGAFRREYNGQIEPHQQIANSFSKILASATGGPAGDIGLLFGYMKIVDPGSTVREGEFATAQNSGSVPEQVRAMYNRVIAGDRLDANVRKQFVENAAGLVKSQLPAFEQVSARYTGIARQYNVDPSRVVYNPYTASIQQYTDWTRRNNPTAPWLNPAPTPQPSGQAPAQPSGQAPAQPSGQAPTPSVNDILREMYRRRAPQR